MTLVLVLDEERLDLAYADEAVFNRLPANARALLRTDALPLLVRLQYMNECHSLNAVRSRGACAVLRRCARVRCAHGWLIRPPV